MNTQQTTFKQQEKGMLIYPKGGWRKLFFKTPLYLWRMGLRRLLPANFLLMTTIGRKSGMPRRTMLEFDSFNGRYYFTSGWGRKSHWVKNIEANPFVYVETTRGDKVTGKVILVHDDEELAPLYEHMRDTSPFWNVYLDSLDIENNVTDFVAKKDRLHIYRVEPHHLAVALPQPLDLIWVLPLVAAGCLFSWRLLGRDRAE